MDTLHMNNSTQQKQKVAEHVLLTSMGSLRVSVTMLYTHTAL